MFKRSLRFFKRHEFNPAPSAAYNVDLTLQLGKLMASRSRYIGPKHWLPSEGDIEYSLYTPELFQKITALIEAGADPHLIVCAYLIKGRLYQRLLSSHIEADFFESLYS
jgi:hypothetical protein